MNTKIIDIINPFLIGRYEKLQIGYARFFKDIFVSDFNLLSEEQVELTFFEDLVNSVKKENKLLTILFVKENYEKIYNLIISQSDKDHNNP